MSEPDPYDAIRQLVADPNVVVEDDDTYDYADYPTRPPPQIRYSESEDNRDELADKYPANPVTPINNLDLVSGDILQRSAGQLSNCSTGSNPVLVFGVDQDKDSDSEEGLVLSAHQPTFVSIADLVPRGFESVRALKGHGIRKSGSVVDRWAEIGYDPKLGRGKAKKQIKEAQSTIVARHGPRIGRRVSSNEGPRITSGKPETVVLEEPNTDENQEEEAINEEEVNKPLRIEPASFIGKTPAPKPRPTKTYWGIHKTLDDTFVTQVDGGGNMMRPAVEPRNASTASAMRRRDLSRYDNEDFDWETAAEKIPPRLREMITHPPESVVFRALCQEPMSDYTEAVISQVVMELRVYLDMCVKEGMIGEGSYVQCVIDNIKQEVKESRGSAPAVEKLDEEIQKAEAIYAEKKQTWKKRKHILEVEKDVALKGLEAQFEEKVADLDEEWNSEKKRDKYNKPSLELMSMRQQALAYMRMRQFHDAQAIADLIAKRERQETREASKRMNRDYKAAQERLQAKMEADRATLAENYDSRMSGIITAEKQDLRPYEQRIQNLKKSRKEALRRSQPIKEGIMERKVPVMTNTGPIVLHAKLRLPPLRLSGTGRRTRMGSAMGRPRK